MPKVDWVLPAARAWRNRRTMFSTSMMASSTTTPTATTRPASTITLTVAPAQSSTSSAATSDSGMAIRLMNAVRHSNKKATMIKATSRMPSRIARGEVVDRLLDEGRRPEDRGVAPRCPAVREPSRPWPPRRPWSPPPCSPRGTSGPPAATLAPSFTTASPISGPGSTLTSPRSASRSDLAVPFEHRHPAEVLGADDRLHVSDVVARCSRSRRIRRCRPRRRRSSGAGRRRAHRPRRSSPPAG